MALHRPARKQVDKVVNLDNEDGSEINIWSGRRLLGSERGERKRERSKYKCYPRLDSGRTKANEGYVHVFCLFFARGQCVDGSQCVYLHRLPNEIDEQHYRAHPTTDIFGRQKMPDSLDNRKGAGSYERDATTLYVHYGGAGHYDTPKLRQLLEDSFREWGEISSIYVVPNKTIAFVKYLLRVCAEFAKEAMNGQGLLGSTCNEVLIVRWANDDPNPVAVSRKKREFEDAFAEAALVAWEKLPDTQRQARMHQFDMHAATRLTGVASEYPNTDAQYGRSEAQRSDDGLATTLDAYPSTDNQYAIPSYAHENNQYVGTYHSGYHDSDYDGYQFTGDGAPNSTNAMYTSNNAGTKAPTPCYDDGGIVCTGESQERTTCANATSALDDDISRETGYTALVGPPPPSNALHLLSNYSDADDECV